MVEYLHTDKQHPSRVIVSLALVQSEIFWFCSVLFCIFRESGLLQKPSNLKKIKRPRAHSEPLKPKPFIKRDFVTIDNENHGDQQRRFSLPTETTEIRSRPSTRDELSGTTCPPLWWQKTRVKLGHAPVHGDPKPKSIKSSPSSNSSSPVLMFDSPLSSPNLTKTDSNSLSISQGSMTGSSSTNDTKSVMEYFSPVTSTRSSTPSTDGDSSSISLSQKQSAKKRFVSKLNSAFHIHRRNGSDPRQ
ncbi:hypothetical protein BDF21DRAFT_410543 [Thamnidium elegans]|uniref:Uncharacterized protein n=1 Tax=Thamnidium elegans TaxID=101142 RepID=A0A8H7VU77_9FUNG|nr:hypothetical protein INT48_003692 [Thamnidium elegans]KAI8091942.1 hypothetical protein BDF21DRAFT_410543 [Thamnidium elegans]